MVVASGVAEDVDVADAAGGAEEDAAGAAETARAAWSTRAPVMPRRRWLADTMVAGSKQTQRSPKTEGV